MRQALESIQTNLKKVQAQLAQIEAKDTTDHQIAEAIARMTIDRNTARDNLAALKDELELLKQKIAAISQETPRITVTGEVWAGTEVTIQGHKHRFRQPLKGVQILLSAGEEKSIVTLGL